MFSSLNYFPIVGDVYVSDYQNNCIRKVTVSTGIITTIAGTGASGYVYSGDGGAATAASLCLPTEVALDSAGTFSLLVIVAGITLHSIGNVYIADQHNQRIRKVTVTTGVITTIAGSSTSGSFSGDGGDATSATLNNPVGVALDSSGTLGSINASLEYISI